MTLKTPWTLIDPTDDGSGILARIVTDAEMGHVAVFESPETARATVETMNRAESLEQERGELERELTETRGMLGAKQATIEDQQRQLAALTYVDPRSICTPAERAVLDAMAEIELGVLEAIRDRWSCAPVVFHTPCLAEIARREEKP